MSPGKPAASPGGRQWHGRYCFPGERGIPGEPAASPGGRQWHGRYCFPGERGIPGERAASPGGRQWHGRYCFPGERGIPGEQAASPGGRQRCMGVVLGTVRRWGAARGHGWPPGCYLWGVWFCRRVFPYHGSGFSLSYLSRLNRFCCCRLSVFHLLSTSCASSWGYCSAKSGRSIS